MKRVCREIWRAGEDTIVKADAKLIPHITEEIKKFQGIWKQIAL